MLSTSIDSSEAQAVHALPHHLAYCKVRSIKFIFKKPSLSGRIARWQVLLSEFDILYVSQKTIKGSTIADFLAERANEEYEPMSFDFPNEDLMAILQVVKEESPEEDGWKMYFDGASNAVGCGVGTVLITLEGNHYPFTAKLSFVLIALTTW